MARITEGTPRPQTGTARKASKAEHRRRETAPLADPRPLLSPTEAARYLDVDRTTVYRLIKDGRLRKVTVGERYKIRPADIDAYLDAS